MRMFNGARVCCLALIACFSFLGAFASNAAAKEFRINGTTFTKAGINSESVEGTIGATEFSVAWLGFAITCSGGELSGEIFKGGSVEAEATFEKCIVVGSPVCTIYETGEEGAGKIHIAGPGVLVEHAGAHYAKFTSEEFATLYILGAKCTLPEEMIASGSAAMKFGSALSDLVEQPFTAVSGKAEGALLGVGVRCNGEPAAILGSGGTLHLSGPNAGKAWGFQ